MGHDVRSAGYLPREDSDLIILCAVRGCVRPLSDWMRPSVVGHATAFRQEHAVCLFANDYLIALPYASVPWPIIDWMGVDGRR